MRSYYLTYIISGSLVMFLFFGVAYFVQENIVLVRSIVESGGVFSKYVYVFFAAFAVVFAPLSSTPIMPIAVGAWGMWWAATLSMIGWTIGSVIAFWISRRYGLQIVRKFVSEESLQKTQEFIPAEHAFWYILFLRTMVPVDVLSYALGLLPHVSWGSYILATVLGMIPFAIFFSAAGTFSPYAIILLAVLSFSALLVFVFFRRKKNH